MALLDPLLFVQERRTEGRQEVTRRPQRLPALPTGVRAGAVTRTRVSVRGASVRGACVRGACVRGCPELDQGGVWEAESWWAHGQRSGHQGAWVRRVPCSLSLPVGIGDDGGRGAGVVTATCL